ncbi:MAG: aminotransferase class I/II-fold pyridoxal phosphate-dependent enzyme [Defluviitaleaceae bacterium]|nr:aminotransferase class I/II-fold pyridoxal phosphate-dependent enzyme [Defluviitaleaceae bacterium]
MINQNKMPLLEAMQKYSNKDIALFDVPGHKRGAGNNILKEYFGNKAVFMDTNSSPSLDNVANPKDIIDEAQKLLSNAYNSDHSFFITNGSTSAIHIMLMSVLKPGEKILIPSNAHKSVFNGLVICGAVPIYMEVNIVDGMCTNVSALEVETKIKENKDVKAVFILNPNYFGFTTELEKISDICKKTNIFLLVDEAHGAHFPFHEKMPKSAMKSGADMSCVSMHKTGGAFTQASAILAKNTIDIDSLKQVINMFQSTSASYLLMGSIDAARYNLVFNGYEQIENAINLSNYARNEINNIDGLSTFYRTYFFDYTKLIINVSGLTIDGFYVYEILWKEYGIQLELCYTNHVLAIISIADTKKNIDRLIYAFRDIAKKYLCQEKKISNTIKIHDTELPIFKISPRDAYFEKKEILKLENSVGRLSGESIMAYPPGIPLLSPGQIITENTIQTIKDLKNKNAFIVDNFDSTLENILVIK